MSFFLVVALHLDYDEISRRSAHAQAVLVYANQGDRILSWVGPNE